MRVTFVLDHAGLAGGVRVVAIYAHRLRQRGHQVQVVSRRKRFPRRRDRLRDLLARPLGRILGQVEPSHFNDVDVEHRVLSSRVEPGDAEIADADVVVATWWKTAEWVAALSPAKGAKAYFVQHYEVHEGQPKDRVMATWRLPMHKIAVSQWLVDLARDRFGDGEVSLVPNAVDHDQFHAPPRGPQPVPTFGVMYHPQRYKGCDICFEALEQARRERADLRLIAFGAGAPVARLPVPAGTEYTRAPAQDELKVLYRSCDAWLFGSRSEGYGLPLLEAMACRTPVIATPAGAAPELLAGGGGLLVRPEDPADMARAMVQVATMTAAHWQAMSEAAHATASRHGWDESTDLFEAALQRAVERSRVRAHERAA